MMPDPNPRGIFNLGRLNAKQQAKLMTDVRGFLDETLACANKPKAQEILERIWALCAEAEPDVATMALMLAGLNSRCLLMFTDNDLPIAVATPMLSMLTAMITDKQMERDEEHASAGHA